jgi:hypothetical protein
MSLDSDEEEPEEIVDNETKFLNESVSPSKKTKDGSIATQNYLSISEVQ